MQKKSGFLSWFLFVCYQQSNNEPDIEHTSKTASPSVSIDPSVLPLQRRRRPQAANANEQEQPMRIHTTSLPDVLVIEPEVFSDERGHFFESFNLQQFSELTGVKAAFVQDNHSRSVHGVVRGLHYQVGRPQGKLLRVVAGEVFDVAVDLRRSSPSFGRWHGVVLSAQNRRQLWIPPGFAHGFAVTSGAAELIYKTTDYRVPESERSLRWDDPALNIAWPLSGAPVLSDKDRAAALLVDAELYA
jgi:dTDP-4-dehydrorhamnose 3,5-epimerase